MRIFAAAALLIVLYLLPWVVNPSASLTPNGYDLAEWSSLHPAVQSQTPPLLTSLLLRLPLACVGLLIAFGTRRSLLAGLIVLITAAALLPPEIVPFLSENPNSRQQSALTLLTLIVGLVGVSGLLRRYRCWISAAIALVATLATLVGLAQAYDLMRGFGLPTQIGAGGVGMILVFALIAGILAAGEIRAKRRNMPFRSASLVNQTG